VKAAKAANPFFIGHPFQSGAKHSFNASSMTLKYEP
jgi:hypothetical protein